MFTDKVVMIDSAFALLQLWKSPNQIINGEITEGILVKVHRRRSGSWDLLPQKQVRGMNTKRTERNEFRFCRL